ncbi:uncharacterized protein At1g66480-like [Nicotiana sylvestris]|uniref:Uncharacterized protein At1g66480-like n=2 Tax=Nicotiana TaxID=4085 RepID=A0A1S3ZSL7_TOBAC|nr:PREDICTED: uncharacterized protein At1g66480-like [Nicotiana sylvestris]XP_016467400.1 PREDICTED: uncharacterized protein At1g66480-like [Nicotiana tabacum]
MGNSLGRKKTTKVMKIDGQIMKFKTPVYANEVLKNYPTMVLLESEEVKHFGVRAKPLEPQQELKSKRLYFLVELPKYPEEKNTRRIRSGIQMSAKDRLETLMLARRSVSDLSTMKPASIMTEESSHHNNFASGTLLNNKTETGGGPVRVKLRLPRAEVEKLMTQSKGEEDVAEKIMRLCMANNGGGGGGGGGGGADMFQSKSGPLLDEKNNWKNNNGGIIKKGIRSREKRVGFLPITEGEIQLAVNS